MSAATQTGANYQQWSYSPSLKQHHRYYRGHGPYEPAYPARPVWAVIARNATTDVYDWACYLPAGTTYGHAPALAAAKRDADKAERGDRLAASERDLAAALTAAADARALVKQIKAER